MPPGYAREVRFFERRWALPVAIFVACASVYCATAAGRLTRPSPNNHYVHLAHAWLHGRFDVERKAPCPPGRYTFEGVERDRYRWFVSFPPLPAVLLAPFVALFGLQTLDALFWVLLKLQLTEVYR